MAGAIALAVLAFSCKQKLAEAEPLDLSKTPIQRIDGMFAVQTENGILKMRMEAPVLERYENDTVTYESFPEGLSLYGYSELDGTLETIIVADDARHITPKAGKKSSSNDVWEAFGNVVIHNVPKQETMETDTIYWDQTAKEIYTHCYVQMYSPDGYMQGTGMRSDDHARNAILHNPYNSYGVTQRDTTKVVVDSVNFIGPLLKN